MRRHTTVDLDPELVEVVKSIGGYGIIKTLCTETLQEFVAANGDHPNLTPADRQRIAHARVVQDRISGEREIVRDCWEEFVKPGSGAAIAVVGLDKRMITTILEGSKEWMFERYGRLPTDRDIIATFRDLYREQYPYFQERRIAAWRAKAEQELEIKREDEEIRQGRAAWATELGIIPPPHAEAPAATEGAHEN